MRAWASGSKYIRVLRQINKSMREIGASCTRSWRPKMTLRRSLMPAIYGLAAGLVASAFSERMLRAVFPAHTRVDVVVYLLVVPLLLAIAMLAAFIPARRASQVDPITALRYE